MHREPTLDSRPKVSVITPVLDRAGVLEGCLDSVLAQTHPDVEHIVVDGGSTDGTVELLEERARDGSLVFSSGRDGGMYEAINAGLQRATGEVLAYLNSDDRWFPWTLELAVAALRDGADLAYGDLVRLETVGSRTGLALQFYRPFDLNHYTHEQTLGQPTLVWRREVTDELGPFDDTYRLLGDCEYWVRAAAAGKRLVHVGDVQAVQLDHDATLRVTQEQRMREEFRRLRDDYRGVAGRPRPARLAHADRSVRWRASQLRLRRELVRREPRRWARFIGFLRDHDVPVDDAALLRFQLPASLRPPGLAWIDVERFEDALDGVLGRARAA